VRPTVALLTALLCACGSDGTLPDPVDSVGRDAGKRAGKDAGKDAGKSRDAGAKDVEEDPSDEAADDEAADDDTGATSEPSTDPDAIASKDAGQQKDAGQRSDAALPAADTSDCSSLTYESFGKKFVATYCTSCHSGTSASSALGGVALDSLANIQKNKAYLKKVTAPRPNGVEPRMPKGGNDALTDEERVKFGAWVDCGPK